MAKKMTSPNQIETIIHEARRTNIPTAEYRSVMKREEQAPVRVSYEKRNPDLDPQLIWRGKYDGYDTLTVQAPPLYIQEKVHPKALIEDLLKESKAGQKPLQTQFNLFSDFNGIP